jgi:hypothetical protein
MLTEKEKKIGIIMLIIGAIVLIAIIMVRVYTNRNNQGIRGSGISDGEERAALTNVKIMTPMFYDNALGENRGESALSQPAALGVIADLIRETDASAAIAEQQARQEDLDAQQERKETPIDYSDTSAFMSDMPYALYSRAVEGDELAFDTKSMTGSAVSLPSVVSEASLALCGIFYDYSTLDGVRAFEAGALSEGNSVQRLYSDALSANYAEGTYCAYIATKDSMQYIGGNELLVLLLGGVSAEDVANYTAEGETLDDLVKTGKVSLETEVGDPAEGGGVNSFSSVYDMCNIGYDACYVEPLGASEQLIVVHLVNNRVYVENYAVGNLIGVTTEDDPESGGYDPESGEYIPGVKEVEMPVFTGYYCW